MKDQIYFYKRAENHKAKERRGESRIPGKGFICIKVWGSLY